MSPSNDRCSRHLSSIVLLAVLLAGCSLSRMGSRHESGSGDTLWSSLDQYVRLDPAPGARNDQPVALTPAQVHDVLGSMHVNGSGERPPDPVFTEKELDALDRPVAQALGRAGPEQDVGFAVIGMHRGHFSLERRVTSGRLFHEDGTLQIIFGALHASLDAYPDLRLTPFPPARASAPRAWISQLRQPQAGQALRAVNGRTRPDWLVLHPEVIATARARWQPGRRAAPRLHARTCSGSKPSSSACARR